MKAGNSQATRDALLSIRGIVNSYSYKFIREFVPRLCDEALSSSEDCKRLKYERLHECFWDKRAVQCVIRQMLDERDDLSSIDSVSANRMDYFANLLIGAANDGKSFSNGAKLREALLVAKQVLNEAHCDETALPTGRIVEALTRIEDALSAPARPCDTKNWRDAWEKWRLEVHPATPATYKECYESTTAFMDWFMSEKRGAE